MVATDRGRGPAAVLLHGQPGQAREWDAVASRLVATARVIVPDRPGYGRTGGPAVGVAANADAVVELLDRSGVESAVVVGHSWGGAIALDLAQRHPERTGALVLVASVGGPGSIGWLDRLLAFPVAGPVVSLVGIGAIRLPRVRRLLVPLAGPSAVDAVEALDRASERAWLDDWRSFVTEQRALTAELPAITAALPTTVVRTVVLIGEHDRVVRPRVQEALAAALPEATVIRLPGRGHLLPWEAPEAIAAAVADLV